MIEPHELYHWCGLESYEVAADHNRLEVERLGTFNPDFGYPVPDEVQRDE
jgi:hypothetical protein